MLKIYGVPISVHTRKVIIAARREEAPLRERSPSIPFTPPPAGAISVPREKSR